MVTYRSTSLLPQKPWPQLSGTICPLSTVCCVFHRFNAGFRSGRVNSRLCCFRLRSTCAYLGLSAKLPLLDLLLSSASAVCTICPQANHLLPHGVLSAQSSDLPFESPDIDFCCKLHVEWVHRQICSPSTELCSELCTRPKIRLRPYYHPMLTHLFVHLNPSNHT